jgi:hypothetical protein
MERRPKGLFLHQRQYTIDILEWASMLDCKPCSTLVDTQMEVFGDNYRVSTPGGPWTDE